jgi:predicted amidohydrolase YtcJ
MLRFLLNAVVVAAFFFVPTWAEKPADSIYVGGRVWTADASRSWATGLAIRDGRLVYVGTDQGARALAGSSTEVVDLVGKMVLPGFCDSHTHPVSSGIELGQLHLGEAKDRADIETAIRSYAAQHRDLEWIVGGGWNLPAWPGGTPTRWDLDALISDRPAFLTTSDAHTVWVNSKALQLAGIGPDTPDPAGGRIERDEKGLPNGLLREEAISLVAGLLPPETPESYREGALRGLEMAAGFGITSVHEANATPEILQAYATLEQEGRLSARVVAALETEPSLGASQVIRLIALRKQWTSALVRPQAAKIFADGVMESRTAAMLQPYVGFPEERGILNWTPEALKATMTALDAAGFQVHAHAIADRGIREVLDAVEVAQKANGPRDARHHIAHLQLIDKADIPRFRRLGVLANVQPLWAYRDAFIRDLTEPVLGPERSAALYPLASLQRSGAVLVAGSDWSVSSMNPLEGMEVALTRQDPDGAGAPGEAWVPDQRLDLPSILAAYTINGAYLSFQEKETGSLEVGKWADLVVLEKDLFEIPASEIGEVRVLLTMLAGKVVYRAP